MNVGQKSGRPESIQAIASSHGTGSAGCVGRRGVERVAEVASEHSDSPVEQAFTIPNCGGVNSPDSSLSRGWEDAIFLLQMAQDATLQPTPSTYTSLFGACRQHGKWRLCDSVKNRSSVPGRFDLQSLVGSQVARSGTCIRGLQLLAEAPQSLSTAAYNAAMSCMAENWRHAIGLLEHLGRTATVCEGHTVDLEMRNTQNFRMFRLACAT